MDSKRKKYEAEIMEAIEKHRLMRFDHVFGGFVSFSRATAYNHELEKLDSIKGALAANRMKGVNYLLQKWIKSDNATLQVAAMRLICEPDEHKRLNQQYHDHTSGGEAIPPVIKVMYEGDAKALKKLYETGDNRENG